MSSVFEQVPVRLQLSIISNPPVEPVDRNTGTTPRVWRRQTAALQIGIFDALNVSVDLTNLAYLRVIMQASQDALTPIWVKQVNAADITKTIPIGDWIAGTAQQASVVLTSSDTDQGLGGNNSADFWIIVEGYTTNGAPLIYGAGVLTIFDPGTSFPAIAPKYVARHRQAAAVDDVTVLPEAQVHTEIIDVGGAARTFNVILDVNGIIDGQLLALVVNLPATANIILNVKSGVVTNPVISTIETGSVLQALLEYYFDADAVAWVPKFYALPPT
jgi:hypothetical protein